MNIFMEKSLGHIVDCFRHCDANGDNQKIYSLLFDPFLNPISTTAGYLHILERSLPEGSTVADVGVGAGIYFTELRVAEVIRRRNLRIRGIDVDAAAIAVCRERIAAAGLSAHVTAEVTNECAASYKFIVSLVMIERCVATAQPLLTTPVTHIKHINWFVNDPCDALLYPPLTSARGLPRVRPTGRHSRYLHGVAPRHPAAPFRQLPLALSRGVSPLPRRYHVPERTGGLVHDQTDDGFLQKSGFDRDQLRLRTCHHRQRDHRHRRVVGEQLALSLLGFLFLVVVVVVVVVVVGPDRR